MIEKLQYRFRRTKFNENAIEDVYDGELYKQHASHNLSAATSSLWIYPLYSNAVYDHFS